jgi:hypothetical protein
MRTLLKLEEIAEFVFSVLVFTRLDFAWWWFPALILVPDLSMTGYLINPKIGAAMYNLVHHKGTGILVGLAGLAFEMQGFMLAGVIVFAHSSMDRALGYGLKYNDHFQHTHLGRIGK